LLLVMRRFTFLKKTISPYCKKMSGLHKVNDPKKVSAPKHFSFCDTLAWVTTVLWVSAVLSSNSIHSILTACSLITSRQKTYRFHRPSVRYSNYEVSCMEEGGVPLLNPFLYLKTPYNYKTN
jgi:hypothetical protein